MAYEKLHALVVDDEKNLRESLAELIEGEGFTVTQATNGHEAITQLRDDEKIFDIIFLDVRMPKLDGLAALQLIHEEQLTNAPIIIVSAFGDSSKTIEAMRLGAYDYITKPLDVDELLATLQRAAVQRRLSLEAARTSAKEETATELCEAPDARPEIIGTSRAIREVFKQIGRLAATDATVLITGETGTGKELVARAVHDHSARAQRAFVAVNCGALPENLIEAELFGHEKGAFTGAERQKMGRFELANTGTLFLDEVGELTPAAQVRLLRAVQERRFERVGGTQTLAVDVRVMAATNRDLKREVEEKRFREDLYYRLRVIAVHLPPLRARLADVPQLAEHFIERAARRHSLVPKFLSDAALRALVGYDYPGNVRELENMIERAVVVASGADVILPEHLFGDASHAFELETGAKQSFLEMPFKEAVATLERELIRRALAATNGNRAQAARRLGINRRLLYSKLEEHKLA